MNVATLPDPTFHTQAVQAMFAAALITVLEKMSTRD